MSGPRIKHCWWHFYHQLMGLRFSWYPYRTQRHGSQFPWSHGEKGSVQSFSLLPSQKLDIHPFYWYFVHSFPLNSTSFSFHLTRLSPWLPDFPSTDPTVFSPRHVDLVDVLRLLAFGLRRRVLRFHLRDGRAVGDETCQEREIWTQNAEEFWPNKLGFHMDLTINIFNRLVLVGNFTAESHWCLSTHGIEG